MNSNLSIFEQVGIEIPNDLEDKNIKTIFESTGLNWEVIQKPIMYKDSKFHIKALPQFVGNFRSDNGQFLGMVHPKEYKVVQNIDAFDFIDELDDFTFEKVGTFDNGRKVFIVGKTNEKIYIDNNTDPIDFYLTFLHGHDGKSSIKFLLCPIRMFCMNQMNMMLESSIFKYMIKHTGDVEFKLAQIHKAVNDSHLYINELESTIQDMLNTKSNKTIDQLIIDLIPIENDDTKLITARKEEARESIKSIYENKDDLQNYKGTVYGMVSAVSDYVSHTEPKRTTEYSMNNLFIKNLEGNDLIERTRLILKE